MNEPRIQPVTAGGKCIGHVMRSARGFIAYDGKYVQVGTFSTAELAIDAIARRTAEAGKRD